ncbi:MAG TPA: tRNA (adenosine(37)-N6)-threonylcarbamoyltransferase complex dimerization subunit type 1 TsaB, partial [Dehalococcoidia bacterium]
MAEAARSLELAIDTAAAVASVALSSESALLAELTWRTRSNHSAELVPAIETVLRQAGCEREQIRVLFVDRGPGGYAGLRVGISTAMGLALALDAELLAAGRLELDAYAHAAFPGPICAIHQAGRGDLAWAVYEQTTDGWQELVAPRLTPLQGLLDHAPQGALFCGELSGLEERLTAAFPAARL